MCAALVVYSFPAWQLRRQAAESAWVRAPIWAGYCFAVAAAVAEAAQVGQAAGAGTRHA